jgi:ATP phosphoribosyltransferase
MKAAGLTAIETVLTSEAVLLSNPHTTKRALVDKFANRIRGIIDANRYVQCVYNAPRSKLSALTKITPGNKAPTIQPLEDEKWVSISAMVPKNDASRVMDELEELGATDILIFPMSNCRLQKP